MPDMKKRSKAVVKLPAAAVQAAIGARRTPDLTHADIAALAYKLYCERRCEPGHDVDDWLQAERELRRVASAAA